MLIARAPVRLSLAGGGTDLPAYYERHGGFVVSTSIDKYFYVVLGPNGRDSIQISSSDYRVFTRQRAGEPPLWDGDLGLVKAVLHELGFAGGLSVFLASQVPPGTGLGSSSTVTVALVKALSTLRGMHLSPVDVAELACTVEIVRLGSPIGKQDQYAAAVGGLNALRFDRQHVEVEPVRLPAGTLAELESNLLLFFTGATRSANTILSHQRRASKEEGSVAVASLHQIKQAAIDTHAALERGDLRRYGEILAESWELKKQLAPGISNSRIDELYALARSRGAIGGKVAGAGGGGFLMVYCEPPAQSAVCEALERTGLSRMEYRFEQGGAQVLMNALARPPAWQVDPGHARRGTYVAAL